MFTKIKEKNRSPTQNTHADSLQSHICIDDSNDDDADDSDDDDDDNECGKHTHEML